MSWQVGVIGFSSLCFKYKMVNFPTIHFNIMWRLACYCCRLVGRQSCVVQHFVFSPHFILQAVNWRVHTRRRKKPPTTLKIYLFSFNEYILITPPKKIFTVWIRYVCGYKEQKTMHKKTILVNEWVENKLLKRWETEKKNQPNEMNWI